jgi:hypothetical protein
LVGCSSFSCPFFSDTDPLFRRQRTSSVCSRRTISCARPRRTSLPPTASARSSTQASPCASSSQSTFASLFSPSFSFFFRYFLSFSYHILLSLPPFPSPRLPASFAPAALIHVRIRHASFFVWHASLSLTPFYYAHPSLPLSGPFIASFRAFGLIGVRSAPHVSRRAGFASLARQKQKNPFSSIFFSPLAFFCCLVSLLFSCFPFIFFYPLLEPHPMLILVCFAAQKPNTRPSATRTRARSLRS